jgi:hypothetical protein
MNSTQSPGKWDRKNLVRGGLWGALLLATAAFVAVAGAPSSSAAPQKSSAISVSRGPAADPAGPNIARAETDILDLQLD